MMIPSGAADVAEPVAVLVALQLADELSAAGSQAGDDGVDVLDGESEMAETRCVLISQAKRSRRSLATGPTRRRTYPTSRGRCRRCASVPE
jgi:hypothetical protein